MTTVDTAAMSVAIRTLIDAGFQVKSFEQLASGAFTLTVRAPVVRSAKR